MKKARTLPLPDLSENHYPPASGSCCGLESPRAGGCAFGCTCLILDAGEVFWEARHGIGCYCGLATLRVRLCVRMPVLSFNDKPG